jgi:hypothetical protein
MSYTIQRRKNAKAAWVSTKHVIADAKTANDALRKFGAKEAFASNRVKVVKGGKTGREYRAVPTAVAE